MNDPYVVAHLVGDVNDFLLEQGRDGEAADFVLQAKGLKATDSEWTTDDLIDLANEYCKVEVVSEVDDRFYADEDEVSDDYNVVNLALSKEINGPLHAPMASTPLDLSTPEYPEVFMRWSFEDPLIDNMKGAMFAILELENEKVTNAFLQDWRALKSHTWSYKAMFQLVWSYITVYPVEEEYGSQDW